MNRRIVIIANNSGGLYDFRHELIEKLISLGNTITVLSPFDTKIMELRALGIQLIETPIDRRGVNPIKDIKLLFLYRRILKKINPQLAICYTIKPNIYAAFICQKLKIPYVANITGLGTAFQKNDALKRLVVALYRQSLKKAKVVFFENENNRQIFLDNRIINENQTCVLPGAGVNLDSFCIQEYPDNSPIHFLFIGRIMKEKGIYELFSSMKKLRKDNIDCYLDVLGRYDEDCSEAVKQCENEEWLKYYGYQLDVRPFINASHCFVLPSWHEGMANTNLECAASGRPIITSDIPGCREAVIEGVSGFLCKSKDPDSLYCAMKRFCELSYEQRREMGLAGRRHMESVFDREKVVEETVSRLCR